MCADLAEAARTNSYVETLGNKADTVHKYTSFSDEASIKRAYELNIRSMLKILRINKVELAIDGKKDLYYGKEAGLNVRNIKHEHGAEQAWEYIVVSIVYPCKLPLMAIPYSQGMDLANICIKLLEYCKSLPIKITKILFDRGFYISHLIDYLESHNGKNPLPYLILVRRDTAIKRYIDETKGSLGIFRHQFKYKRKKSSWKPHTTIVVCKNAGKRKDESWYDLIFATNLNPSRRLIKEYKRRWNIETGFRIMEEAKIKTKSNNPVIRLFYFLLRALFIVIWLVDSVLRVHRTFKSYLRIVEKELRKFEVYKPPPIKPIF